MISMITYILKWMQIFWLFSKCLPNTPHSYKATDACTIKSRMHVIYHDYLKSKTKRKPYIDWFYQKIFKCTRKWPCTNCFLNHELHCNDIKNVNNISFLLHKWTFSTIFSERGSIVMGYNSCFMLLSVIFWVISWKSVWLVEEASVAKETPRPTYHKSLTILTHLPQVTDNTDPPTTSHWQHRPIYHKSLTTSTHLPQVTDNIYHMKLLMYRGHITTYGNRTHNFSDIHRVCRYG